MKALSVPGSPTPLSCREVFRTAQRAARTSMKALTLSLTILALAACGGGGGGGNPVVIPDPPDPTGDGGDNSRRALLLPAGSAEAFADYIKAGLGQWSGLTEGSSKVEQTLLIDTPMVALRQEQAVNDAVFSPAAPAAEADGSGGFSDTNVVVQGVDEIDAVRYNGEYLFLANQNRLQIARTSDDGPAEFVSTLAIGDNQYQWLTGLYLYASAGQTLVAAVSGSSQFHTWTDAWFAPWHWNGTTRVDLVDATVASAPLLTEGFEVDGDYVNSRRIDNTLILITRYTPSVDGVIPFAETTEDKEHNQDLLDSIEVDDVLPRIRFDDGTDSLLVTSDECLLPRVEESEETVYYPTITTVTAVDLDAPGSFRSLCMAEGVAGMHVTRDAIFLAAYSSALKEEGFFEGTTIHKLSIDAGQPAYVGSGRVPGTFWGDPNFLMGVHDGNLTAITTSTGEALEHSLTILGDGEEFTLDVLGQIPNDDRPEPIGKPGEQIFASRITGDRAYVVTFERIDPVYVIDLSVASDPQILGELAIPGFSTYLHPISDNLLLGVGKDAETVDNRTLFQGMNVRLFDVSDPSQLSVLADIKIGGRGTESPLTWDPHALSVLETNGIHHIAIPVDLRGASSDERTDPFAYQPWIESALYLFEADSAAQTLNMTGKVIGENHDTGERYHSGCCSWSARSVIDGDTVHYLNKNNLITSLWSAPEVRHSLFIPTVFAPSDIARPDGSTDVLPPTGGRGIYVTALDRVTGQYLGCSDSVVTSDGTSVDLGQGCDDPQEEPAIGPGIHSLVVKRDSYETWQADDIHVQSDGDSVFTTWINVYLQPLQEE